MGQKTLEQWGAWPRTMALLISDHTTMGLCVSDLGTIGPRTIGLSISDFNTMAPVTIALTLGGRRADGGRRAAGGGRAGGRARAGAGGGGTIAPWHNGLVHYMRGADGAASGCQGRRLVVNSTVSAPGRLQWLLLPLSPRLNGCNGRQRDVSRRDQ